MKNLWVGIAICGIYIGTGIGLAFGADPKIVIGSVIATLFVTMVAD